MTATFRSEKEWIESIQSIFASAGALDLRQVQVDAVQVDGHNIRVNVDCAQAGTHFPWPTSNPRGCGYRALAAALSDLAAVGATPSHSLLSAVIPGEIAQAELKDIDELMAGFAQCANDHEVQVLGGNVARGSLSLHTTVIGRDSFPNAKFANGLPGDLIWLTGTYGDAMLQLHLESNGKSSAQCNRYWLPKPRFEWGTFLWRQPWVVAVTDVSDGWLKDVCKLRRDSTTVGVEIDPALVPRSEEWLRLTGKSSQAKTFSYWGGDDYELAFLTRAAAKEDIYAALDRANIPAQCIGQMTQTCGISWQNQPEFDPPDSLGYDPYR